MNLADWLRLAGWIAVELTAVMAAAAVLETCFRSPRARRAVWQAAFAGMALIWVMELAGLRDWVPLPSVKFSRRFVVTVTPPQKPAATRATTASAPPVREKSTNVKWPGWIWLAGTALFAGRLLLARLCLTIRWRRAVPADAESGRLIAGLQTALGLRGVRAQVWPELRGPVAFGVIRPVIALPEDFDARFSDIEKNAMLAHELAHLAARDPFWLTVSDAVLALAWWHPFLWLAQRRFQSVCESAADEASALVPDGPNALATCLVRLGRELSVPAPARVLSVRGSAPKSQLAARVTRLLRERPAWAVLPVWMRWAPHFSAALVAGGTAFLPVQTGISASMLMLFAAPAPVRAESSPGILPPTVTTTNPSSNVQTNGAPLMSYQWYFNGSNLPATPAPEPKKELPKVKLHVQLVSIPDDGSDGLGLDWLFGVSPANNPQTEVSHDWAALGMNPRDRTNDHPRNISIDLQRTDGQSAVLDAKQFAALLKRIEAAGADLLTAPSTISLSGLQTHIASEDLSMIVTGVLTSPPGAIHPSVNYLTDKFWSGFSVDINATAQEQDKWRLVVLGSLTSFLGYDNPDKPGLLTAPGGGKPVEYVQPLPHFRKLEAVAEETVPMGQTLAIRGPLWSVTAITKGHWFSRAKTRTTRQRMYVFVTPTPAPAGSK